MAVDTANDTPIGRYTLDPLGAGEYRLEYSAGHAPVRIRPAGVAVDNTDAHAS